MSALRTKSRSINTLTLPRVDISVDKSPGKRNLAPENGGCQHSTKDKVREQTSKTGHAFLDKLDAIAYGIEARYELITGHSRRVTEETIAIARELGIPENEIERWASFRLMRDIEKVSVIKHLIEKTEGSFLAGLAKEGI